MISELLTVDMRVVALLCNKELNRSRSDNDGMNMQVVLNASIIIIITDVLIHLGSMHNSFILHVSTQPATLSIFTQWGMADCSAFIIFSSSLL